MPAPSNVTVRPIAIPDADAVQKLWSARFGGDPETQDAWIEAALDSQQSVVGLAAEAVATSR